MVVDEFKWFYVVVDLYFSHCEFFFLFCSRHVAICLVRTTGSVSVFTRQTATFASARKYSQESSAKTVRKLKRQLRTLARTTSARTHPKM